MFIAYADIPAARHAMTEINQRVRCSNADLVFQPMLWRFDQLAARRWHDLAARDATRAPLVVVALSDAAQLNDDAAQWLKAWAAMSPGKSVHALLMIGDEPPWLVSVEQLAAIRGTTKPSVETPKGSKRMAYVAA